MVRSWQYIICRLVYWRFHGNHVWRDSSLRLQLQRQEMSRNLKVLIHSNSISISIESGCHAIISQLETELSGLFWWSIYLSIVSVDYGIVCSKETQAPVFSSQGLFIWFWIDHNEFWISRWRRYWWKCSLLPSSNSGHFRNSGHQYITTLVLLERFRFDFHYHWVLIGYIRYVWYIRLTD